MSQTKTFQFYLIQHRPQESDSFRTIPLLFNDEKQAVEVSYLCILEGTWTVRCLTATLEGDFEGRTDEELREEARLDLCIQLSQGPLIRSIDGSEIDISDSSDVKPIQVQ